MAAASFPSSFMRPLARSLPMQRALVLRRAVAGRLTRVPRVPARVQPLNALQAVRDRGQHSRAPLPAAALAGATTAALLLASTARAEGGDSAEDSEHVFVNWSATHECRPRAFFTPESVADVERLLREFHARKQKLRCMGAGVSPNGLGFSGQAGGQHEALMSLALFDKVLHVDAAKRQVTVEAGKIVGDLLAELRAHGLTMQNVASIREQQLGGICQAGCHGTGAGIPPIDDQIVEMEVVTPAKGRMVLSATQNPELFALAKCGLGALGVVTKLTIQCVPAHRLAEKTTVMTLDEVRQHHTRWLLEYQHLRYMWIPFTDAVVVVQCRRLEDDEDASNTRRFPPVKHSDDERLKAPRELYVELTGGKPAPDYLDWGFTKLRDRLLELNPLDKDHVVRVNQAEKEFWKLSEGYRVALSDDIIGFDCGGQQLVQEVAFPTHGTLELDFVEKLLERVSAEDIPAHSPIEQRWTSRSQSPMSPAASAKADQLFCWVGVIMYLPSPVDSVNQSIEETFHRYYETYQDFMVPYGAVEHWAKIEWSTDEAKREAMRDRLAKRYPLDRFKKARDEVDPHHILSNHIVDELCA